MVGLYIWWHSAMYPYIFALLSSLPRHISKFSSATLIKHDDYNPHCYGIERAPSVNEVRFK
jgi:hypothetical protein